MDGSSAIIRFKIFFANEADGAVPLFGEVFESCSCGNIVLWITYGGIIYPVANKAFILLHGAGI